MVDPAGSLAQAMHTFTGPQTNVQAGITVTSVTSNFSSYEKGSDTRIGQPSIFWDTRGKTGILSSFYSNKAWPRWKCPPN